MNYICPFLKALNPKAKVKVLLTYILCVLHRIGKFDAPDLTHMICMMNGLKTFPGKLPAHFGQVFTVGIWPQILIKRYLIKLFPGKPRVHFGQGKVVWGTAKVGAQGERATNSFIKYFLQIFSFSKNQYFYLSPINL